MKKCAILLGFLLLTTTSAFAQYQQFGVLAGSDDRFFGHSERASNNVPRGTFRFSGLVEEAWYGIDLEPDTIFKVKLGRMHVPVGAVTATTVPVKGTIDHLDTDVEYRFSEAFGTTGLFAGVGYYRASAASLPRDNAFGFNLGVNGDFPMTKTLGGVIEVTYHVMNLKDKPRVLTATAGVRIRF